MQNLYNLCKSIALCFLLVGVSCTDHDIPELPDVEALAYLPNCKFPFPFNVDIHRTGSATVLEYGIVYAPRSLPADVFPDVINDYKVKFDEPFLIGKKTKNSLGACAPFVYYRSYVIVEGGAVIYGPVQLFRITG